ncbi:MAG: ribosomal protein S18-alanine N-acetyltransferase [Halobacteriota archaeon]|nr:ribosomal protein S18-alanine N-acetyltransferase [Halobacteriota archaeon]
MIRPANDDDLPKIIRIWKDSIETNNTANDIAYAYRMNKEYWFVFDDGQILGFVAGTVKTSDRGHISGIAVVEGYRRRGIGRELLTVAENCFILKGYKKVTLEVRLSNRSAQKLYESEGFKRTYMIKRYYPDGEDAINYEKILVVKTENQGAIGHAKGNGLKNEASEDVVWRFWR